MVIKKFERFILPLFFLVFLVFQTNFLNSGDAGELVSASFFLGIAHPSGYPLYLLLSKFATLLPFGNVAFKVTLISSIFGSLVAYILFKFIRKQTNSYTSAIFASLFLIFAYSFFNQAVIAKFYQLNAFIILIMFIIGTLSLSQYSSKIQYILFFLLGLSLMLHQTALLMLVPFSFLVFLHFKHFIKHLPFSIFLFILGFIGNVYLFIRSLKPNLLIMEPVYSWHSFWYMISRSAYGKSSSIHATESGLIHIQNILNTIFNTSHIIDMNFHFISIPFFLLGLLYLARKNIKLFIYYILTLLAYGIILGLVTLSSHHPGILNWYIVGNQYFIPLLVFYAMGLGFGFYQLSLLFNNLKRLKPILIALLFIPIFYFPVILLNSNYSKDDISFDQYQDLLFTKPIGSIIVVSGDNDAFGSWYMKNVDRFRDDLCIISTAEFTNNNWSFNNGCNPSIYSKFYPFLNEKGAIFNVARLKGYMEHNRVYISAPSSVNNMLKKHTRSEYNIFYFLMYPKTYYKTHSAAIKNYAEHNRLQYEPFINWQSCLNIGTDDLFSHLLCSRYATYFTYLAHDKQPKNGKKYNISIFFSGAKRHLAIKIGKSNIKYMSVAALIVKYNKTKDFYLLNGK